MPLWSVLSSRHFLHCFKLKPLIFLHAISGQLRWKRWHVYCDASEMIPRFPPMRAFFSSASRSLEVFLSFHYSEFHIERKETTMATSSPKPNILLILSDEEQNWTWLEKVAQQSDGTEANGFGAAWPVNPATGKRELWYGYQQLFPTRYSLMQKGLSFRHYYTPTAPCSPARSVIFTGLHTAQTRVFDNVDLSTFTPSGKYYYQDSMLPYDSSTGQGIRTIGQMLAEAGYYCAYKGKWHLTRGEQAASMGLVPPGHAESTTNYHSEEVPYFELEKYGFHDWQGFDFGGSRLAEGYYDDGYTASDAIGWLETKGKSLNEQGQPWFLAVSFVNPHDIAVYPTYPEKVMPQYVTGAAPNLEDPDNSNKPAVHALWRKVWDLALAPVQENDPARDWLNLRNSYLEYHRLVDIWMGHLVDALQTQLANSAKLADNTIITFSADHGELGGAHKLRTKGPEMYYESKSAPLIIAGPPGLELSRDWQRSNGGDPITTTSLASHLDLAPTFLTWAGVLDAGQKTYGLKGHILTPILKDPSTTIRQEVLFTSDAAQVWAPSKFTFADDDKIFSRGIFWRDPQTGKLYKYGRYFRPGMQAQGPYEYELYDWSTEEGQSETVNQAGLSQYEELMKQLDDRLNYAIELEGETVQPHDLTGKPTPILERDRGPE